MAIKSGFVVKRDKLPEMLEAVKTLTSNEVLVGIPSSNADRPGETLNNAQLGYIHEYGVPSKNIPARPWLVPGVQSTKGDITKAMRVIGEKVLQSDRPLEIVSKGLHALGATVLVAVKVKLTNGPFAPLAPLTLARRKARGHEGESPLIDTSKMLQSVNYVVRVPTRKTTTGS